MLEASNANFREVRCSRRGNPYRWRHYSICRPGRSDDTAAPQTQISALPSGSPAAVPVLQLPPVTVYAPSEQEVTVLDPYTSGLGPRPSSLNNIPYTHFEVPPGYDADVTMHPYTSGIGPCTEGAQ